MKTEKILEMINNNKIEELKKVLQDEIFTSNLKGNQGKKKRYTAMKKYFNYVTQKYNEALLKPCKNVEVDTEMLRGKYNCFCDSYSVVLTIEDIGEIEPYNTNKGKYFDIERLLYDNVNDLHISEIDFNLVLAKAKSLGYKLKKSEVENSKCNIKAEYLLKYKPFEDRQPAYFKMGLFDKAFSIINDGKPCEVFYLNRKSPLFIKSSIGLCLILPINASKDIEKEKTIIEALEI